MFSSTPGRFTDLSAMEALWCLHVQCDSGAGGVRGCAWIGSEEQMLMWRHAGFCAGRNCVMNCNNDLWLSWRSMIFSFYMTPMVFYFMCVFLQNCLLNNHLPVIMCSFQTTPPHFLFHCTSVFGAALQNQCMTFERFNICRGIRQGSAVSLLLFLLPKQWLLM